MTWNNSLTLERDSEVMVPLAGPYILYICAYVKGNGNLTLSQGGTNITTELKHTDGRRCVRYQRVISLYDKETVTFEYDQKESELVDLRLGLHYLLGTIDFRPPDIDPDD